MSHDHNLQLAVSGLALLGDQMKPQKWVSSIIIKSGIFRLHRKFKKSCSDKIFLHPCFISITEMHAQEL